IGSYHPSSNQKLILIPTFVNAHTHIGDAFIRKKNISIPNDIKQLVAPPDGLKHVLLRNTNLQEIIAGINQGLKELRQEGTTTFVDFRENGLKGINILKEALKQNPINAIILGRPEDMNSSEKTITSILKNSDGIAISSMQDYSYDEVVSLAELTKKANKMFALHVSERIREPIQPIINLHPNFIVHMTQASKKDLQQIKHKEIPIVVCPRSNHFFGMKPNIKLMKEIGNIILLGSDNFMVHLPSILNEIRYIQTHFPNVFSLEELFHLVTYQARKALNLKDNIPGSTFPRSWIAIDPDTYQIKTLLEKVEEG
ncbi:MAG: amidohydrolase family protein, partial [Candidatus Thermoplasmatota archaeon]|nr:amidohydrolase family protein [Candidatus Thermoplasmatota archaeon]